MSTIATTSVFDWKAYENGLLKQHNPSYFDNSTRMRSIAAGMVACAAALASYAIRAKITSTPIIITGSALVTIVLLVSRRIFNKTYSDQKVHQYITLCKDYINKAAQEKKGLRDIQNEKFHLYSKMKSIIWAHIKHHELSLSYSEIFDRNGSFIDLLTPAEKEALGKKFIAALSANAHAQTTINIAEALLVLDQLAQSKIFKEILFKAFQNNPIRPDVKLLYETVRRNKLISEKTVALFERYFQEHNQALQAYAKNIDDLNKECEKRCKDQEAKHKEELDALNLHHKNMQASQLDELSLLKKQKAALEAKPADKREQLSAALGELAKLSTKLARYNTQLANQQQLIEETQTELDELKTRGAPQLSKTILSFKELSEEIKSLNEYHQSISATIPLQISARNELLSGALARANAKATQKYNKRLEAYYANEQRYSSAPEILKNFVNADAQEQSRINDELLAKHLTAIKDLEEQLNEYTTLPSLIENAKVLLTAKQDEINLLEQEIMGLLDAKAIAELDAKIAEKKAAHEHNNSENAAKMQELKTEHTQELSRIHSDAAAQQTVIGKLKEAQKQNAYTHFQSNIKDALLG